VTRWKPTAQGRAGVGRGDSVQADRAQVCEQAAEAVHGQGGRGLFGGGFGQGARGADGATRPVWAARAVYLSSLVCSRGARRGPHVQLR
jgi:hypothetical protein